MSKPVIISNESIHPILDGQKTQLRRVMKPQPILRAISPQIIWIEWKKYQGSDVLLNNPYGKPGEKLWVKETWRVEDGKEYTMTAPEWEGGQNPAHIEYRVNDPHPENIKWRSSIHMPRWASRLTLEINVIRVEKLQDISEEDCIAEGMQKDGVLWKMIDHNEMYAEDMCWMRANLAFREYWDLLNAKNGWLQNPWCWCISFKKV